MVRNMITPRHSIRSVILLLIICTVVSILGVSCSKQDSEQSRALLQGLPPDLARFLSLEDDSSRTAHAREIGIIALTSYSNLLYAELLDIPPDIYDRDAPMITDYLFRVTRVIASEYDYPYALDELEYIHSLPQVTIKEIYYLRDREKKIYWNDDSDYAGKISQIEEIIERMEQLGDWAHVNIARMHISSLYSNMGDVSRSVPMLREAIRGFEENGQDIMLCQALGVLGSYYEDISEIDSMINCYESALRMSMHHRHPTQVARISTFYAGHYIRKGRFGLGHELLHEAIERCRDYKGGTLEARYICRAMEFYADLECWDLVADLLDRINVIQRLYSDNSDLYYYRTDLYMRRADEIRARFEMTRGEVERAESIFERIVTAQVSEFHPVDQTKIYYYWAKGLADNHQLQRAEDICSEGIEYAKRSKIRDWEARLILLEARVEYERGDMQATESRLKRFSILAAGFEDALYEEMISRDGLMGRVRLSSGDVEGAFANLISGLDRLVDHVAASDASAHSYLLFEKFEDLKGLLHDLVAYSPSLGYGVELYWRQFYRNLGAAYRQPHHEPPSAAGPGSGFAAVSLQRSEDILNGVRTLSEQVLARITERDAIHCSYTVRGDEVWRWVVSSGRIRRETLDITVDDLRKTISETLELMTALSEDDYLSVPSELTEKLRMLAQIMLPEDLLEPSDEAIKARLYITAGGFLSLVPFETFNVGERGEYEPLLQERNVVYLRHTDIASAMGGCDRGVIVVNTEPTATMRNKRLFAEHLSEIIGEGDIMAEADENAVKLVGREVTKSNLLGMWSNASYIYFATHIFRDSEVPYLVHIPLAEPEKEAGISMKYLDATDIHAADFSRCRLVVLSGCSSGAPYCEELAAGPALGDVFLDSGVDAVIHTNWNVEDESAKKLMGSFIRFWCDREMSPADALCEVRRDAMRGDGGIKHPFAWASYSIKVGFLD